MEGENQVALLVASQVQVHHLLGRLGLLAVDRGSFYSYDLLDNRPNSQLVVYPPLRE